ncbi:MAG: hypothetical protein ACRDNZ_08195 [Streptosporangiaceae bacterium]
MTTATRWLRRRYGDSPLHLLALIVAFGLAGYALSAVVAAGQWLGFAVWFGVAIAGHDLLAFPLYSLADLALRRLLPGGDATVTAGRPVVPVLNYVRVPAAFSLLVFLVWFPLILGLSAGTYRRASGLSAQPYLGRWLAFTGGVFLISAVWYALALRRAGSARRRSAAQQDQARHGQRHDGRDLGDERRPGLTGDEGQLEVEQPDGEHQDEAGDRPDHQSERCGHDQDVPGHQQASRQHERRDYLEQEQRAEDADVTVGDVPQVEVYRTGSD